MFRKQLEKIIKNYPETKEKTKAEEIVALLENPEKMLKINNFVINWFLLFLIHYYHKPYNKL